MIEIDKTIKNTRIVGIIFFVLGVIIAISAGAKVPQGNQFPDTLPAFLVGLFMAIIGNVVWHRNERKIVLAQLEHHKNDSDNNPVALLEATVDQVAKLQVKAQNLEGMELCAAVDEVLDNFIHPFVEKRKTFTDMLGAAKGAEILLIVAYGERMLNRCWSAASDGHKEEALNVLEESLQSFKQAVNK